MRNRYDATVTNSYIYKGKKKKIYNDETKQQDVAARRIITPYIRTKDIPQKGTRRIKKKKT